ncbi:lytic transglycosylase domain-containing protein [Lentibacter algarum]|uniref:lytic transglycosylase domain-containing protein n=1 Tax=Lentibacter algarum TaxID=576131 RepID=UPI001C06798E|nr:lytic transglycosylase domain-containing protein [Lentibacter algarum]MBU2980531.1 lytic transglycosylase domain-containing protein [Lentibacter algarum]
MQEMFARFLFLLAMVMPVGAVFAEAPAAPRPLSSAIVAASKGDWATADVLAAKAAPEAQVFIEWLRLQGGAGPADAVLAFVERYPHWPGLERLKTRNEKHFRGAPNSQVLRFFKGHTAQTGQGILTFTKALIEAGERDEAEATLIMAWRSFDLSAELHKAYLKDHAKLLAPHHEARLDMALFRGLKDDANRMIALVSDDQAKLARARLQLRAKAKDPEAVIASVPEKLRSDPGLKYEEFLWNYHRGSKERTIKLMLDQSEEGKLGEPARWAGWRRSLARQIMREDDPITAYRLAINHGLTAGSSFADLEWLAGYIALRKLNNAGQAVVHFKRFIGAVETPISLGRAGFWLGEAYTALGKTREAQLSYEFGGQHQTSFYGLLAAERAGLETDSALSGSEYFPAWQEAEFAQGDLAKLVALLAKNGQLSLAEQFILKIGEDADRKTLGQLGNFALDIGAPHLAVMLGKASVKRGITLPAHYYALHPMQNMHFPVPVEMSLAIARRESEFDPSVASGAGALGLMQLMPPTAAEVAGELGHDHVPSRVLNDWRYNAELGSAYLAKLAERYDGNVIMMAAAYNAGPSRPDGWMNERGDPRQGVIDVIDWIESIPFDETRNYVMRVAESLPVYRARLGDAALPVPFSKELVGGTMRKLQLD